VADSDHQWLAGWGGIPAIRSNVAYLARFGTAVRDDSVFRQRRNISLATRSPAWLRCWTRFFLDMFFLDYDSLRARMVRPPILSRHLFRGLDMVLWIDEAAGPQNHRTR